MGQNYRARGSQTFGVLSGKSSLCGTQFWSITNFENAQTLWQVDWSAPPIRPYCESCALLASKTLLKKCRWWWGSAGDWMLCYNICYIEETHTGGRGRTAAVTIDLLGVWGAKRNLYDLVCIAARWCNLCDWMRIECDIIFCVVLCCHVLRLHSRMKNTCDMQCMVTVSYYMLLYTLCKYILNHMQCFIFALDFSREQYSRVISEHNPFKPFLGIWLSRKRRRPNGWSCCSASETEQMRKCADAEYAEQMFSANSIESNSSSAIQCRWWHKCKCSDWLHGLLHTTTLGVANLSHWKRGSIKHQRLSFTHEGAPIAQVRGRKFGSPENARLVAWAT